MKKYWYDKSNSYVLHKKLSKNLYSFILKPKITLFHLLSFALICCQSSWLDVPFACLLIDDPIGNIWTKLVKIIIGKSQSLYLSSIIFDKYLFLGISSIFNEYSWRTVQKRGLSFALLVWACMFLNSCVQGILE